MAKRLEGDELTYAICELKSATTDTYKGQKPWVVYYDNIFEQGELVKEEELKEVRRFIVDESVAAIFTKQQLKAGTIVQIEREFTDDFRDNCYVVGYTCVS